MVKKIIITVVLIAVLAGISFFFFNKVQAPVLQTSPESSSTANAVEASTQAKSSVSSGVQKTNPFNVDVNPYQGYKNPFQ